MDLLILCETVTADGSVSNDEVRLLQKWLIRNQGSTLPAIEFLSATVERIVEDGRITPQERDELHDALERVMPAQHRTESRMRRLELEQRQLREAEDRSQQRKARRQAAEATRETQRAAKEQEEREEVTRGDRALIDLDFSVAGVTFNNRNAAIKQFATEGQTVYLVRDRENQHSPNAIEVILSSGQSIGFVPERLASELARLFDSGYRHLAYIKFIHCPNWDPDLSVPVIEGGVFVPRSQFPGAVSASEVPVNGSRLFINLNQRLIPESPRPQVSPTPPSGADSGNLAKSAKPKEVSLPDPYIRRVLIAVAVLIAVVVIALWLGHE